MIPVRYVNPPQFLSRGIFLAHDQTGCIGRDFDRAGACGAAEEKTICKFGENVVADQTLQWTGAELFVKSMRNEPVDRFVVRFQMKLAGREPRRGFGEEFLHNPADGIRCERVKMDNSI